MVGRSHDGCGVAPLVLSFSWRHALTLGLCGLQELTFLDDDVTVEHARVGAQRQAPPHTALTFLAII